MADLSDKNSSAASRIVGADSSGVETNFVDSNSNGKLYSADISNNGGTQGTLTVGTTAVELKVGGSALSNRISATAYNDSSSVVYWGYTSGVTTSNGTPLEKKQFAAWAVGPSTTVYLIAGTSGNIIRITESA